MPYGSVHLFFCPSLILRSLSIPLLSFALLGDLLSLIFFASWTLLFPRTLPSYKSSGFLYCYSKQNLAILLLLGKCMETKKNCGLFAWNHNHAMRRRVPKKFVCNSHHHVGNVGPLFVLWVAYKRVQNKWWWKLLHITKTALCMLDRAFNKMRSKTLRTSS